MSCSLDATVNGASSDSYATIDDANEYWDNTLNHENWSAILDSDNKTRALKTATRILDEKIDWVGTRATTTQALGWGRTGVTIDGITFDYDEIPVKIKQATCELANTLTQENRTQDPDDKGLKRIKVDTIDIEFDKNDTKGLLPTLILEMLRNYGDIKTRGGFSNIGIVRS